MRADMAKLVTEKERAGSRYKNQKWGGRVPVSRDPDYDYSDHCGGFHPWGRHRNYDCKSFSDFLSPVYGWLRKNIGRPWDDLYSEAKAVLRPKGLSGYHVFYQHLLSDVERNTFIGEDGKVWYYPRGGMKPKPIKGTYVWHRQNFYVHPVDGTLRQWPSLGRRPRYRDNGWMKGVWDKDGKQKDVRFLDIGGIHYILVDGLWYETEMYREDVARCERSRWLPDKYHLRWEERIGISRKRQIGGRELRRVRHAAREKWGIGDGRDKTRRRQMPEMRL